MNRIFNGFQTNQPPPKFNLKKEDPAKLGTRATYGEMHTHANKYLSLVTTKNWLNVHNNVRGVNVKDQIN